MTFKQFSVSNQSVDYLTEVFMCMYEGPDYGIAMQCNELGEIELEERQRHAREWQSFFENEYN